MELLIKKLTGRVWYHQRFDAAPLYLSMIGKAETFREERKPAGTEAVWRICFYSEGSADWYLDQEDIDRGAAIITKLCETSADVSGELMRKWEPDERAFQEYFDSFKTDDLNRRSDEELLAEYKKYCDLAFKRSSSSSIIDHFALGTDRQIADLLRTEVGKTSESDFNTIFSIATAPVSQSFINEAEISLLKIGEAVQAGEKIDSPVIRQAIETHTQRYFWIANNYVKEKKLSSDYFQEELVSWVDSGKDLKEERKLIEQTPVVNRARKEKLMQERTFSKHSQRLLKVSEDFTHWQDERKKATYLSIHLGCQILGEMARRRGIEMELTKYLLPSHEVEGWFLEGSVTTRELAERKKNCVVVFTKDTETAYTKDAIEQIRTALFGGQDEHEIQDVRGLVASTGRAIGTARIVTSAEDIGKVLEGDILVAVMTRPDYVPAMKKAAAIVTDEGGITSHAAIVARELRVPCIIGTKIASKVFKDGDRLEVNANHNWVRKLS